MPPVHEIPHYHGDAVRALFVVAAVLILVGEFLSSATALPAAAAVLAALALVVAAGITSPAQTWIHWADALLAASDTLYFGATTIQNYRAGGDIVDPTGFAFALALALIGLIALYFSTRTILGMMLREPR